MRFDARVERTIGQVLAKRASDSGDKPWLVTDDRAVTFGEMDELSGRLANGFVSLGISAGETVLLMLPDSVEILMAWCALSKIGAIEVPVNVHLRGTVLAHVINDSAASTLVVHERFLERIAAIAPELQRLRRLVVHVDEASPTDVATATEIPGELEQLRLQELLSAPASTWPEPPTYRDLQAVMYTSGTTGPSKGVMVTHLHAYEYALSIVELLELERNDVYYNPLPLFHIAGQWGAGYGCCIVGATAIVPPAFSLARFWPDVRKHGATTTFLLGAMANWIYRQPRTPSDADNPLERALVVPLLPEIENFKKRFDCLVSTTWGSTEINVPTRSTFELADNKTCGRVADDRYEVRLVDANDEDVPVGVPGEAVVRSKEPWILMAGYWRNPAGTVDAWRNQWIHSGDMLMRDEAGNFYFVDRTKDAIRRRGENISSMEVENEVNAHPPVLECAVIPVQSEDTEQEVMAVLVAKDGETIDFEALIEFLEPRMAHFMVPRYVEVMDALPKTQTGKIQKFELRKRGLSDKTWDRVAAGIKIKR